MLSIIITAMLLCGVPGSLGDFSKIGPPLTVTLTAANTAPYILTSTSAIPLQHTSGGARG